MNFKLSWKEVRNWNGVLNLLEMRARMELLPKLNQSPLPTKKDRKITLINTAMCIMWREHVMWIHVLCALLQTQWSARCYSWRFFLYLWVRLTRTIFWPSVWTEKDKNTRNFDSTLCESTCHRFQENSLGLEAFTAGNIFLKKAAT